MPVVTKSLGSGTQSVLLTVEILEHFAARKGSVSISELAREVGTSKSRIFRHLQTLVECGYVSSPSGSGDYQVGPKLLNFCRSINARYDMVSVAQPIMTELRNQFGHTVILSRVDASGIVVLNTLGSDSPITIVRARLAGVWRQRHADRHAGASGYARTDGARCRRAQGNRFGRSGARSVPSPDTGGYRRGLTQGSVRVGPGRYQAPIVLLDDLILPTIRTPVRSEDHNDACWRPGRCLSEVDFDGARTR